MNYGIAMHSILGESIPWWAGETYASCGRGDGLAMPSDSDLQAAFSSYVAPKIWSKFDFWSHFTTSEQQAILISDDPQVAQIRFGFPLKPNVQSNDAQLLTGLAYLTSIGILAVGRENTILAS